MLFGDGRDFRKIRLNQHESIGIVKGRPDHLGPRLRFGIGVNRDHAAIWSRAFEQERSVPSPAERGVDEARSGSWPQRGDNLFTHHREVAWIRRCNHDGVSIWPLESNMVKLEPGHTRRVVLLGAIRSAAGAANAGVSREE